MPRGEKSKHSLANRTPGRVARALMDRLAPDGYGPGRVPMYEKAKCVAMLTDALQHVLAPDVLQTATVLARLTDSPASKLARALLALSDVGRKGLLGRFRDV